MNPIASALTPDATTMIRMDHTHLLATFHQYRVTTRPHIKLGLVNTTCLALEVHARRAEPSGRRGSRCVPRRVFRRRSGLNGHKVLRFMLYSTFFRCIHELV
jgi:hypothetical protein